MSVDVGEVKAYAEEAFRRGNIAVVGTNIEVGALKKLVDASFAGVAAAGTAGAGAPAASSKYFGGETRLEGHEGPQTIFIGFGTSGTNTTSSPFSADLATLAAHLSTTPSIKWSKGLSPVAQGIPSGTTVQSVYLPYSDASLFGVIVQGETVEGVRDAGKVVVEVLKGAAKGGEVNGAVAKAKFGAASLVERREGLVDVLGSKVGFSLCF